MLTAGLYSCREEKTEPLFAVEYCAKFIDFRRMMGYTQNTRMFKGVPHMKKILCVFLALLLLLTACGQNDAAAASPAGDKSAAPTADINGGSDQEESSEPDREESSTPNWEESYDLGVSLLSEGNYEAAIAALSDAITLAPDQALSYVRRGRAYLYSDGAQAALQDFEAAAALDGSMEEAWLGAAAARLRLGDGGMANETLLAASGQVSGLSGIYDIVLNSAVFMGTRGGTAVGEYLGSGSGYYCDADLDGDMDWIVNLDNGYMILEGGDLDVGGYLYGSESYKSYFRYSDAVGLVIQMGEFTGGMELVLYRIYNGDEIVAYARMVREMDFLTGEYGFVSTSVYDAPVTQAEYDSAVNALGELPDLPLTPFAFEQDLNIDPGCIEYVADILGRLPYAAETSAHDLDGDGEPEYLVHLLARIGSNITFGDFATATPFLIDSFVILSASGDAIHSRICTTIEAAELLNGV